VGDVGADDGVVTRIARGQFIVCSALFADS
jgi:hypothetical protein